MTGYEAYKLYLALKNHFNSDGYDFFKYNGKGSGSTASFDKRKDKIFFDKLAKHKDPKNLIVANLVKNPKYWVRDLAYSEEAEQNYLDWVKRQQSLTYLVTSDLSKLNENFNDNFIVNENEHPNLLRLYCSGSISAETLCVLVELSGCYKHWSSKLQGDQVWEEMGLFIKKYTPFLKYDKDKMKKIMVDKFS